MSMTGLDTFDATVHKTNRWLNELMQELCCDDKQSAYLAMRAAVHALRDRLTVEEVAQLGSQLPMLVRGFYYEGWDPTGKPLKERHKDQFLARIAREVAGEDPEQIAKAVFTVLAKRVSDGEIENVKHILPAELRELWPGAPPAP
jgi:uncharacterized protein (DUF2267 family)